MSLFRLMYILNNVLFICQLVNRCSPVPGYEHSTADTDLAVPLTTVHYHCHPGYHYNNQSSFDVTCMNGTWLGQDEDTSGCEGMP